MIFKQFHLESLGHASYFVGSEYTGKALVVEPRRDVEIYLEQARNSGMRIAYALDTHQHNDYVSGLLELQARTGAELLAGDRAEVTYDARKLGDGEQFKMGEVLITALHTPGHTPEHLCLLITDLSRGREPIILLSGGLLLVGDVGRPDLLGGREAAETQARTLYRTLSEKILTLPDHVAVYPTHVAGSLCGGNIGSLLSTTIGYERRLNKLLKDGDEAAFVERVMEPGRLPSVPPYWRHMRAINQRGAVVGNLVEPPAMDVETFDKLRSTGTHVLDCRSPEAFAVHIPGAFQAGLGSSFPTWAGTVLPFGEPYLLVIESGRDLWEACWQLLRIGYSLPEGWLGDGMFGWRTSGKGIEMLQEWTVHDLRRSLEVKDPLFVLDVRQPAEWAAGHIAGALHIPGAELPQRLDEVPRDRTVAVICGSGYRSTAAGSILARRGSKFLVNIMGGMRAWRQAGYPTVR